MIFNIVHSLIIKRFNHFQDHHIFLLNRVLIDVLLKNMHFYQNFCEILFLNVKYFHKLSLVHHQKMG